MGQANRRREVSGRKLTKVLLERKNNLNSRLSQRMQDAKDKGKSLQNRKRLKTNY